MTAASIRAVVFDLGGVLIDWDPRHLYRRLFPDDEAAMERFLAEVCSPAWNLRQDAGRPWVEAVEELAAAHPADRDLIVAYRARWPEMLGDAIAGTVTILDQVRATGLPCYALSNWSAETFPIARDRYPFLGWFDGIVISGDVGVCKPDPRIYWRLLDLHRLEAGSTFFVDDHEPNVVAARELGFDAVRFHDPEALRRDFVARGVLEGA